GLQHVAGAGAVDALDVGADVVLLAAAPVVGGAVQAHGDRADDAAVAQAVGIREELQRRRVVVVVGGGSVRPQVVGVGTRLGHQVIGEVGVAGERVVARSAGVGAVERLLPGGDELVA